MQNGINSKLENVKKQNGKKRKVNLKLTKLTCRNDSRDCDFVNGVLSKHQLLVVVLFVDVRFGLAVEGGRLRPVDLLNRELRVGLEWKHLAEELDATLDGCARPLDDANLRKKIKEEF